MSKNKGITLFGLSGVLLFIFAPVLFPVWVVLWIMKLLIKFIGFLFISIPLLIAVLIKMIRNDKK